MNKWYILMVLTMWMAHLCGQDMNTLTFRADSSFCNSIESPQMFLKGSNVHLKVTYDTVYLINKGRYNIYKALHKNFMTNQTDSLNLRLLVSYEAMLMQSEHLYHQLAENNQRFSPVINDLNNANNSLQLTYQSLEEVQSSLQETQTSLMEMTASLEQVYQDRKKEKFWTIAKSSVCGIVGGLIIGALVFH